MHSDHSFEAQSESPLYLQIAAQIKQWIDSGRLKAGDPVPSTRHMANLLGVARRTVMRGYELLISQGYLSSIAGIGTVVSQRAQGGDLPAPENSNKLRSRPVDLHGVLSQYGKRLLSCAPLSEVRQTAGQATNSGAPPPETLPIREWRQLLVRHLNHGAGFRSDDLSDPFGHPALRAALAEYLRRVRGVKCSPDQVVVFSASQHALDLIARLLLNEGDLVVVENPGFPGARMAFGSYGAEIAPVAVDGDGLVVDELRRIPTSVKLVHVTSFRHDPTGVVLSAPRRQQLLDWARQTGALILEDDFDSDYRYGELPVTALQGLDRHGCVVFVSTFWKTLFPISPLGILVIPDSLVEIVRRAKNATESLPPVVEQLALTDFIREGWLERHILRTQRLYSRRRQALIYALTVHLKGTVTIAKRSAGMHFVVRFSTDLSDEQILDCAVAAGLPLTSTKRYYVDEHPDGEFLIAFASLVEESIYGCVQQFAELLRSLEPNLGFGWPAADLARDFPCA